MMPAFTRCASPPVTLILTCLYSLTERELSTQMLLIAGKECLALEGRHAVLPAEMARGSIWIRSWKKMGIQRGCRPPPRLKADYKRCAFFLSLLVCSAIVEELSLTLPGSLAWSGGIVVRWHKLIQTISASSLKGCRSNDVPIVSQQCRRRANVAANLVPTPCRPFLLVTTTSCFEPTLLECLPLSKTCKHPHMASLSYGLHSAAS